MRRKKIVIGVVAGAIGAAIAIVLTARIRQWKPRLIVIQGAVIRRSADPHQRTPIPNVLVSVSDPVTEATEATTVSSDSGYFEVTFRERISLREAVNLNFRHPDYKPLNMQIEIGLHTPPKRLYIAAMTPTAASVAVPPSGRVTTVSDLRIRYTENYRAENDIGAASKIFEVVNEANAPCKRRHPCSPDGLWKASRGSITLDAGKGDVFRNARAFCIAGPCPFTRIDSGGFVHGGQTITASAIDWSGTAVFLFEAEVYEETIASSVRVSYPVVYGRGLHFTLPPTAEGPSIEADLNQTPIVFPLGTGLYMSWARCISRKSPTGDKSTIYDCELKPGYRF